MITSLEVRRLRDEFWKEHAHVWSTPAPLINTGKEGTTTLFNVAGMQPLVPYLMGKPHPDGVRLYNIQACIRTPDMEDIGDERHLTCFEMMGNWSLGDYFKEESITRSFAFLTQKLGIPLEKLGATVFAGDAAAGIPTDDISIRTLESIGVQHIKPMGFDEHMESDNFWRVGPIGPCGPCCEIYYDRGDAYGPDDRDMGVNDRYTEIWNNVFMSYYDDGSQKLAELPKKNVDTGMGFERLIMVLQSTDTIYETDVFAGALRLLESVAAYSYPGFEKRTDQFDDVDHILAKSYRIVVDHLRASSLLLYEGLTPSNEGHGYVLRRVIRRMWYHLNKLSPEGSQITERADFTLLLESLISSLLMIYPHMAQSLPLILHGMQGEMNQFSTTIAKGTHLLQEYFNQPGKQMLTGAEVFKMYDTYGIPMELTKEVAAQVGFSIDEAGYYTHLEEAKARSREQSGKMFTKGIDWSTYLDGIAPTEFLGYTTTDIDKSMLLKDFMVDEQRILIFDRTPFYAESGGQKADVGKIILDSGETVEVVDVQKYGGVRLHFVK